MATTTVKARNEFSTVINRAAFGKERIVLTRRGKQLVAVIPIADLKLLEEAEDRFDLEKAHEALAEEGRNIPWKKIKRDSAR